MNEGGPDEARYRAFLSYSHKDAADAGRLHRRLEAYRLPRRLVGLATPRGPVPERLAPIFRDREELPAASDLSETVRAALAQSQALIVLCSPHSAESLWVAEEIKIFREMHPGQPILAAVLEGDPPACFPPVLRAFGRDGTWHEPLATDLRPHRDGSRLGLLKLVAGITGVSLDALVQRDAQRKLRRVTAVTTVTLVAMLVMAALTWFALDARREAERQRAEAEGLVDFMLTDLRTRLRAVGRIDVMQAVNQRALAYYAGQDDFGHRARILHAMGEDEIASAHLDAALTLFREAHRTTTARLARAPNDPERLLDHARSEYWIGRVYELRRQWPMAHRQYLLFAGVTRRLIAAVPDNPDYMMEVGWSALDLGNLQLNGTRDLAAAQHSYEAAISWFERAARARPHDENAPRVLANAYGWLADSFYSRRLWPQSLEARRKQYLILERLYHAHPDNADYVYRFALAQRGFAALLAINGDHDRAQVELLKAHEASDRLTAHDSQNAEWLQLRAMVGCQLYLGRATGRAGPNRASLRSEILNAVATLAHQGDPRTEGFSHCVNALH